MTIRSCHSRNYFSGVARRGYVRRGHKNVLPWHIVAYDGPEEDSPLVPGFDAPVRASEILRLRYHLQGGANPKVGCQALPVGDLLEIYAGCTMEDRRTGERFTVPRVRT